MRNEYFKRYDDLSKSFQSEQAGLEHDLIMESAFSSFPIRSKTDNPKRIQE